MLMIMGWYLCSLVGMKINYALLHALDSAPALALSQMAFACVFALARERLVRGTELKSAHIDLIKTTILPLGATLSLQSVFYNLAMEHIPVSLLNTIKSTVPLWTCLICSIFLKQKISWSTYGTLVIIVIGVGLASLKEIGFHAIGIFYACGSAICQTLYNLFAKSVMETKTLSHHALLIYSTGCSSAVIMSLIGLRSIGGFQADLKHEYHEAHDLLESNPLFLAVLVGLNYYYELTLSVQVIQRLGALNYALSDVIRRLVLIISAFIMFGNPATKQNVLGIGIALVGVFLYNYSKGSSPKKSVSPRVEVAIIPIKPAAE
jgi:drug/metabolite transporter (DMT)-like permease